MHYIFLRQKKKGFSICMGNHNGFVLTFFFTKPTQGMEIFSFHTYELRSTRIYEFK